MSDNIESDDTSVIEVLAEAIEEPSWAPNAGYFARAVLQTQGFNNWEFSILFTNDEYMRELNHQYRGKDSSTDVLSFAQISDPSEIPSDETFFAGDIVISLETLAENAAYFQVDQEEELKRLIIHGILHLAGYDHSDNSPDQPMLRLQESILSDLKKEKLY